MKTQPKLTAYQLDRKQRSDFDYDKLESVYSQNQEQEYDLKDIPIDKKTQKTDSVDKSDSAKSKKITLESFDLPELMPAIDPKYVKIANSIHASINNKIKEIINSTGDEDKAINRLSNMNTQISDTLTSKHLDGFKKQYKLINSKLMENNKEYVNIIFSCLKIMNKQLSYIVSDLPEIINAYSKKDLNSFSKQITEKTAFISSILLNKNEILKSMENIYNNSFNFDPKNKIVSPYGS